MEELATMQATLLFDRGHYKFRINMKKGNRIFGFIRPLKMEGRG